MNKFSLYFRPPHEVFIREMPHLISRKIVAAKLRLPYIIAVLLLLCCNFFLYSQEALQRINGTGNLKVGILEQDTFPFAFKNLETKQIEGYLPQRAKELATLLNARLKIFIYPNLQQAIEALNSGTIELIFHKIFYAMAKKYDALPTLPLAKVQMVLVVNRAKYASLKLPYSVPYQLGQGNFKIAASPQNIASLREYFPYAPVWGVAKNGANEPQIPKMLWNSILANKFTGLYLDEASARSMLAEQPLDNIYLQYVPLNITQNIVGLISRQEDFFLEWVNIAIEGWGEPLNMNEILSKEQRHSG